MSVLFVLFCSNCFISPIQILITNAMDSRSTPSAVLAALSARCPSQLIALLVAGNFAHLPNPLFSIEAIFRTDADAFRQLQRRAFHLCTNSFEELRNSNFTKILYLGNW
jgi:hypothetical protein